MCAMLLDILLVSKAGWKIGMERILSQSRDHNILPVMWNFTTDLRQNLLGFEIEDLIVQNGIQKMSVCP